MAPSTSGPYNSCDACRRKKVRCLNEAGSRCTACSRSDEECTYLKGYKKPGRPSLGVRRTRSPKERSVSPKRASPFDFAWPSPLTAAGVQYFELDDGGASGQSQNAQAGPGPSTVSHAAAISPIFNLLVDSTPSDLTARPQTAPTNQDHVPLVFPSAQLSNHSQIEDIAPWTTISFFLTLYLRYMHSLFPIVHRPSFSQALTMRADQSDRNLRALILAIVAYTIGQAPLSRMEPTYSREDLERLQRRCHRASILLLNRSYSTVTLAHVGVMIANYFCCQSMGQVSRAFAFLSEACQLCHILRLQEGRSDGDIVEQELRRRIFWHVYAVDITEAAAGNMIHMQDYEGFPPLPMAVDDELITPQGAFPQPDGVPSYMAGFNGCVQLFPLLSQCIVRSRQLQTKQREGNALGEAEVQAGLDWESQTRAELDERIAALPPALRTTPWNIEDDPTTTAILGMQRANILVTAASLQIAMFDYVAELTPHAQLSEERSRLARRAYETLSSIPLDDLAANGESIRGKIFRIVMTLLRSPDMDADWVDMVHSWWSLFSCINFVQLVPRNMNLESSGVATPA